MYNHTSILVRLNSGKGIVVYGFDEKSEECIAFLEEIKSINNLNTLKVPNYISEYTDEDIINKLLEDIENTP
jgi:hypothetical protein